MFKCSNNPVPSFDHNDNLAFLNTENRLFNTKICKIKLKFQTVQAKFAQIPKSCDHFDKRSRPKAIAEKPLEAPQPLLFGLALPVFVNIHKQPNSQENDDWTKSS
jgi:hypothetical protein